jgi:hypothetical protein
VFVDGDDHSNTGIGVSAFVVQNPMWRRKSHIDHHGDGSAVAVVATDVTEHDSESQGWTMSSVRVAPPTAHTTRAAAAQRLVELQRPQAASALATRGDHREGSDA